MEDCNLISLSDYKELYSFFNTYNFHITIYFLSNESIHEGKYLFQ